MSTFKKFMHDWLLIYGRCWTSDRLQRQNLQNQGPCSLCSQSSETIEHLFFDCVYSKEVWFRILRRSGLQQLAPTGSVRLPEWWLPNRKLIQRDTRKGFDSLVILVLWSIWKERNNRVFNRASLLPATLAQLIIDEGRMWCMAGNSGLSPFIR